MGGEVIRGTGGNRPTPFIPRGVEANAGEPLRPRQQPLPAPLQPNLQPLHARNIRALVLEMVNDLDLLLERIIERERDDGN